MKNITIPELNEIWRSRGRDPKQLILDVRTPEEYADGHVPGSRNIPHDELTDHLDSLQGYSEIHVYCRAGRRAHYACEVLKGAGISHTTCVSEGGFPDWERMGFPVE